MYFPNAFKKVYVAATSTGSISLATTGTTAALTAGQVGLFDAKTYAAISAAPSAGTNQPFILAQGSYHTVDKIGPFHGGYKESVKSKVVNPKYVSRIFTVAAKTPLSQVILMGWNGTAASTTDLQFVCGKSYHLRIDIKGSPALRFLDHNLYHTFDYYTGCCSGGCTSGCTGDPVDSGSVNLAWATQINGDPIFSKFISAQAIVEATTQAGTASSGSTAVTLSGANAGILVGQYVFGTGIAVGTTVTAIASTALTLSKNSTAAVSGTLAFATGITSSYTPVVYDPTANSGAGNAAAVTAVTSSLLLSVAYVDTVFGNCTFTVSDKYDLEPLFIYVSVTDDANDPCAIWPQANTSTGLNVVELQTPRQASGVGETVLRDLILFKRYMQEPFHDGSNIDQFRMRETEDEYVLNVVTRSALYDMIYLLHNVPRLNNSTGIFDNDQYLLEIVVPTGTTTSALTTLLSGILTSAGNTLTIDAY